MNILIADSGSTKTDWRLISSGGKISQFQSSGYNPNYQDKNILIDGIKKNSIDNQTVDFVYFYGAGCSLEINIKKIKDVFHGFFPDSTVEINHDLLAAARSLCGNEPGIACILGTGANSCYFNGEFIEQNVPSLGYILGDEGSGSWLGNQLVSDFIREDIPSDVREKLTKRFGLTRDGIIESVYQKGGTIQYLSGFSKFIFQNIKSPYLYKLVYRGFEIFFEKNIMKYEHCFDYPVHFTGSVAFYYGNILRQVANDKGITLRNIVESPIAGLTLFHQKKLL